MSKSLEGKVAAITGASSGIGEATALTLAKAGAAVAVTARRGDRLEDLAKRIEAGGGKALPIAADIAREDQARGFIEKTHKHFGRLDILVNNAGLMLLGMVEGADTNDWRRMFDVNVLGLLYCTTAALPLLREHGGDIVNISSTAGRIASFGAAIYNFTKFGVTGFTEALRQEALNSKIRASVIEPGFVDTELQGHNTNPMIQAATKKMREEIGDVLKAEDIANAILYVVSQPPRVSVNEMLIRPSGQRR